MEKQQAWEIIYKVTGMVTLSREDHQKVLQALEALKPEDKKEDKEKK